MFLTLYKVLQAGCCGTVAYLILSGCTAKPPYEDVPYTPSGKVNFDSLNSGNQPVTTASPSPALTKQQSAPQSNAPGSTAIGTAADGSDAAPSPPPQADAASEPKSKCTGEQESLLTLNTESYEVTVCDDNGSYRYHGTYLPSGSEAELPALLSDSGYYIKENGYEYWVTPKSIAIYQGKELLQEEFAR
ncbi:hypothetical protein C1752_01582 [Acaryochloris thomasi RCC1774]|uniref:Lipoprotein n=1 Tax=Acaryochloris thomasi RCC1774 TaxID=1764569 RepID=A0A2W1JRM4_9CYAN|nr:hypothetical protein [Acaryochloris thomasi]PZD73935.1 hypothetical protein C1752_01582 [Acaryochloris thomasi RCC1774]